VGRSLDITIYEKDDQVLKTGVNKEVGVFYRGAGVGYAEWVRVAELNWARIKR
jgi:hypothetical protein